MSSVIRPGTMSDRNKSRRGIFSLVDSLRTGGSGNPAAANEAPAPPPPLAPQRPSTRGAPVNIAEFAMPLRTAPTVGRPPFAASRATPLANPSTPQLPRVATAPSFAARASASAGSPNDLAPSAPLPAQSLSCDTSMELPPRDGRRGGASSIPPKPSVVAGSASSSQPSLTPSGQPPLGRRPASQQRSTRPVVNGGGAAGATSTSNGSNRSAAQHQHEFHRGLVSALQDVLRQQRQGIFPGLPTATPEGSRPGTSSNPMRPATRDGLGGSSPGTPYGGQPYTTSESTSDPMLDENVFMRPRNAFTSNGRRPVGRNGAPSSSGLDGDAFGSSQDIMASAATVQMVKTLIRQEGVARSSIVSAWESDMESIASEASANLVSLVDAQRGSRSFTRGGHKSVSSNDVAGPATPQDAASLRAEGNEHYLARRFVAAHRCYSLAMELDPNSVVLLTNRAAVYTMLLNYDACIRDCMRAATIEPTSWKAFSRMARAYALTGQYPVAARHYTTALLLLEQQQQQQQASTDEKSQQLEQLKTERGALSHLERYRREAEQGNHQAAVAHLGNAATFVDEPPMRLARVSAMTHFDPVTARSDITKHLVSLEQPPPANVDGLTVSTPLLQHTTNHYCAALMLAAKSSLYCGVHFLNIATAHLQLCMAIKPDHREAATLLNNITVFEDRLAHANEQSEAGNHAEAIPAFDEALAATDAANTKVRSAVLLQRAESLLACASFKQAAADCDLVLNADGNNTKALLKRSRAHEGLADFRAAVIDLEHAATINSDYADLLVALKLRAQQQGRRYQSSASSSDYGSFHQHGSRPGTGSGGIRTPAVAPEPTLYEVLGVSSSCDGAAIRAAYRKLTLQLHPDKVVKESAEVRAKCEVRFKQVAHAYSVLNDPSARLQYDLSLR